MNTPGALAELALPAFDDGCVVRALPLIEETASAAVLFREDSDGFEVEEVPAYLPSGEGEHLYLHVEKRDLSTGAFVRRLIERFGLDEREVGYAGRKDERGVTRQWLSVPARKVEPELPAVEQLGVRVVSAGRHNNKLRLGHLRGNRFTIRLAPDHIDVARLQARAAVVGRGVPNVFGAQRFGVGGSTLAQAVTFLARGRPARGKRDEFLISALQSALFNAWLAARVDAGTWRSPLDGDMLEKVVNGAPFQCANPAEDAERAARGEVVVAGPLVGRAMRSAARDALTFESQCWERLGIPMDALLAHPALSVGARRPACVAPADLEVTSSPAAVTVQFSLGKGAYASVVLRALLGAAFHDSAFDPPAAESGQEAAGVAQITISAGS